MTYIVLISNQTLMKSQLCSSARDLKRFKAIPRKHSAVDWHTRRAKHRAGTLKSDGAKEGHRD